MTDNKQPSLKDFIGKGMGMYDASDPKQRSIICDHAINITSICNDVTWCFILYATDTEGRIAQITYSHLKSESLHGTHIHYYVNEKSVEEFMEDLHTRPDILGAPRQLLARIILDNQ